MRATLRGPGPVPGALAWVLVGAMAAAQDGAAAGETSLLAPAARAALRARTEGGGGATSRLEAFAIDARAEGSLDETWRLGLTRSFVLYRNAVKDRLDYVGSLDAEIRASAGETYRLRADQHTAAEPSQAFTGRAEGAWSVARSAELRVAVSREVVEESMLSTVGESGPRGTSGQVRADLAEVQTSVAFARGVDAFARAWAGVNEGLHVGDNFRWGVHAGAGFDPLAAPDSDASLRIGAEVLVQGFDRDLSGFFRVPPPRGVGPGGYFSPQLHVAPRLRADLLSESRASGLGVAAGAGVGMEQLDSATRSFARIDPVVDAHARVTQRLGDSVRLEAGYAFDDGGAEVRAHRIVVGIRIEF